MIVVYKATSINVITSFRTDFSFKLYVPEYFSTKHWVFDNPWKRDRKSQSKFLWKWIFKYQAFDNWCFIVDCQRGMMWEVVVILKSVQNCAKNGKLYVSLYIMFSTVNKKVKFTLN